MTNDGTDYSVTRIAETGTGDVTQPLVDGGLCDTGDIDPAAAQKASWISPNPGGVGPMTRAMLVTVLHRAAGSPSAATGTAFSDVPSGAYYMGAVAWASANGIAHAPGRLLCGEGRQPHM